MLQKVTKTGKLLDPLFTVKVTFIFCVNNIRNIKSSKKYIYITYIKFDSDLGIDIWQHE